MRYLLIDGSPKAKESTSSYLLAGLAQRLAAEHTIVHIDSRGADTAALAEAIAAADAAVIAFPLYVDSIPSHLLRHLEALEPLLAAGTGGTRLYAIVNSGFYDARQNHIALSMARRWAERSGLAWGCGVGIGGGGMAQSAPLGHGPVRAMGKALDALATRLEGCADGDDLYAEPNFPRFLYRTMAHIGWRRTARAHGVSAKAMKRQWAYAPPKDAASPEARAASPT